LQGNELAPLDGHKAAVRSAVFSPDGQRIVTASWDWSAKVWDLQGNELGSLDGHKAAVNSAVFSPDGQRIVTASWDWSAKVWDVPPSVEGLVAIVKARLTRGFSEPECRRFFRDDPDSCPRTVEEVLSLFEGGLHQP
jgi:WD40 repeat protein